MLNQEMRTVTMNRSDMLRVAQALTHVVLGFRDEVRAATTEDRRRSAKCSLDMWERIRSEFDRQMDERVVKLWREGQFKEFCNMLPEYADYCYGEGNMHDTVMLLGMLGWDNYDGKVEFLTELFASSGTGG